MVNELSFDLFLLMNRRIPLLAALAWSGCKVSLFDLSTQVDGVIHWVSCAGPGAEAESPVQLSTF